MSSIVQIKDSAYDGMQSLRVYGNTVQNLWVNPSGTNNGLTVTSNEDGTMTLSGTSTASTAKISVISYIIKPSTQYTFSCDNEIDGGNTGFIIVEFNSEKIPIGYNQVIGKDGIKSVTFTTQSNVAFVQMQVYCNVTGTTVSGTYRVMLNEGSTAEPWCPPGLNSVGDDGSVDIVTAGKNLVRFNSGTHVVNGITYTIHSNGSVHFSGTSTTRSNYPDAVFDLPAGDYVLSGAKNGECNAFLSYTGDDGTTKYVDGYVGGVVKFTLSSKKTVMISYDVRTAGTVDTTLYPQLELGSTATAYEPPSIITTSINLQGNTLNSLPDGTRDELHIDGGGNVVLEKRVHREHIDASELQSNHPEFCEMLITKKYRDGTMFNRTAQRNDFAPVDNADGTFGYPVASVYTMTSRSAFRVGDGTKQASSTDQLTSTRQKIGTKGVDAMWALLEPQTIDLGTIELPKLRKKPLVNTIWANGTAEGAGFSLAPEIDCEYNRWSTYCDGFKTHGKHSYFDMGCCLAARDAGAPEKKSVTATVPYMSGFYDFSKLYGAIAFEARQLTYRFEFVEDSREELQQKKSQFLEWLSQVHDEEIADDDIPGRHFIGSLSEWEFEEGEEGQSGSLEVTFNCQPFLEADEDTTKTCNAGSNTVTVEGQAVNAYAKTSSGTATIQIGGVTQSVGTTEIRLSVQLQPGDNAVTVTGSPVVLRWKELTA